MNKFYWRVLFCLMLSAGVGAADARAQQDSIDGGWMKTLIFDLTTTQAAYSESWRGGEAGSFNWVTNLNGTAEKHFSSKIHFRTVLKLSFGQTSTQDESTAQWSVPRKTTDKIDWDNVVLLAADKPVDPYASFRLESRFYDGSHPSKLLYLSPLTLTESAGVAHRIHARDNGFIELRIGLALKQEITKFIIDSAISVSPVEYRIADSTKTTGGIEVVSDARLTLRENISYVGKLILYQALFFSDKDATAGTPSADDWKKTDIAFDNVFTASITGLLKVNLHLEFLYDRQVSSGIQIRETIALGIAFNLMS